MLYKFHQINKFLYQLLIDNNLWFSDPREFNDPFDMRFFSNVIMSPDKKENMYNEMIKNVQQEYPFLKEDEIKGFITETAEQLDLDKNYNTILLQMSTKFGICCFSETVDNILMWSHYTDGHKGLCLEFDFEHLSKIEKSWLIKVKYSNDFPIVNGNEDLEKAFTTKSSCWYYEKEFRILASTQGLLKFPKEALKSIIFGAKSEESEINRIIKLVNQSGYKDIAFKRARIDEKKYQLNYFDIML